MKKDRPLSASPKHAPKKGERIPLTSLAKKGFLAAAFFAAAVVTAIAVYINPADALLPAGLFAVMGVAVYNDLTSKTKPSDKGVFWAGPAAARQKNL